MAIIEVAQSIIVVYADDNTPITSHKDPDVLEVNIQKIADNTRKWITDVDNMLAYSGEKTKLLVVGTATNRSNYAIQARCSPQMFAEIRRKKQLRRRFSV